MRIIIDKQHYTKISFTVLLHINYYMKLTALGGLEKGICNNTY